MKCNHCGAEISDDSVFCEHCGKKLRSVKRVDIRWCLLPVAVLFSIVQTFFTPYWTPTYIEDEITLLFFPMALVFLITIVCGIMKWVQPSFIMLICYMLAKDILFLIQGLSCYRWDEKGYYYDFFGTHVMTFIEWGLLLIYIVYAIIASKKNLKF